MWKKIACVFLILIAVTATPIYAGESEDISVTARPYIAGAPAGFTVTWITDQDILLEWTTGIDSVATMVRAKFGEYPSGIDDGYLVYSGAGESVHDTALNLDETASEVYYRAWSQNNNGIWTAYEESSGDSVGGSWVLLIMFALIAVGLTWAMFQSKSAMLGFPCAIFWGIFGGAAYQQSVITWDIYYLLFFGSFGMVIFTMFAAFGLRTKKEEAKEGDLYFDEGGDNDIKFVDEGKDEDELDSRRMGVRERAARRRARWA